MMNDTHVRRDIPRKDVLCEPYHYKHISWTAIIVGALIGIGLGFLLNLFGVAIGLTAWHTNPDGARVIGWGGFLGLVIGVIVSMLAAGYATGYLSRHVCAGRKLGILYGFTTWSVALLISAALMSNVGSYVSAYSHLVGSDVTMLTTGSHPNDITATATKTTPATTERAQDRTRAADEVTPSTRDLAYGAFVLFLLFLIGAISSCVGACLAMTCKYDDEVVV